MFRSELCTVGCKEPIEVLTKENNQLKPHAHAHKTKRNEENKDANDCLPRPDERGRKTLWTFWDSFSR